MILFLIFGHGALWANFIVEMLKIVNAELLSLSFWLYDLAIYVYVVFDWIGDSILLLLFYLYMVTITSFLCEIFC